jgi:hypothetical protein
MKRRVDGQGQKINKEQCEIEQSVCLGEEKGKKK